MTGPRPMSEDDYLALITRLQQAMAVELFCPSIVDVALLASEWRMQNTEIERLRALIDKHNDEHRECPVIEA